MDWKLCRNYRWCSYRNGAVIGAGSIVTKDVPPYAVVAGCPARIIRYRFDEEKRKRLLESKWWEYDAEKLICEWENLNR